MGNVVTIPIAQGFYASESLPLSAQRCVNWQPNVPQTETITDANLFNTPGISQVATVSNVKTCRGAHVMADKAYFVIGQNLYRFNDDDTTDNLGTIPGESRVSMADNGTQLCICAPPDDETVGKSFIFSEPSTLTEITDANFDGPALSVVYLDGFFVFVKADGKKLFNSALNDGLAAYDALDFSTATANPDNIKGQIVHDNNLYLFGTETVEIFRNIGRSPAPFQRIQGAIISIGVDAPNSIIRYANAIAFVGSGKNEFPAIWLVSGTNKTKLSTTAIDRQLSKLNSFELQAIYCWTYAISGAYFLGVTLPDTTLVYDSVNQRWHERQSIKRRLVSGATTDRDISQYRVSHIVIAYGEILLGDSQDGRIGKFDEGIYTEYDELVNRFCTTRPFDNNGNPIFLASLEAVCESGVGLIEDVTINAGTKDTGEQIQLSAGKKPHISLSWSDDGGRTFTGGLSRSLGKIGEYKKRQIWRRIGRFPRSRVLKFSVSSPVKSTLIKVEAEIA